MGELFSMKNKKEELVINGEKFHYFDENDTQFLIDVINNSCYNNWNLNYANILAHNNENYMNIVYQKIDNALCLYAYYPNSVKRKMEMAFVPIKVYMSGEQIDMKYICSTINERLSKVNDKCNFQTSFFMPQESVADYKKYMKSVSKATGFVEFIYNLEYLSTLEGSKLKNVRRDYNRFERDYPNTKLVPYEPKYEKACIKLKHKWEKEYESRTTQDAKWKESFKYHLKTLFNSDYAYAYVLLDNDNVIGYMNAVHLYDCTCACINRITDNTYNNSSNYILIRVIKELYSNGYEFMNDGNAADQDGEHLTSFKNKYLKDVDDKVFIYQGRF